MSFYLKLFVVQMTIICIWFTLQLSNFEKMSYSELSSLVILFFLELIVLLTFRGETRPNKFHGSAPILKIRLFYDKKTFSYTIMNCQLAHISAWPKGNRNGSKMFYLIGIFYNFMKCFARSCMLNYTINLLLKNKTSLWKKISFLNTRSIGPFKC
jgi:hypothetical protein